MKILFLDIDGVLNSSRTVVARGGFPHGFSPVCKLRFDNTALALVRNLCAVADVSVVLSSSWRLLHSHGEVANELDLPIMAATPNMGGPRGAEIAAWLAQHPEVSTYAIVDDDSDMPESQLPCFVRTDAENGLTFGNYRELCAIFGVNEYDRPPTGPWGGA